MSAPQAPRRRREKRSRNAPAIAAVASQSENIRVACRIRPPSAREQAEATSLGLERCVLTPEGSDERSVIQVGKAQFTFDYIAGEASTQEELFEVVGRPMAQAVMHGYNGTVLAYGQTGSGKTHTLFGADGNKDASEGRGVVPRCLEFIFGALEAMSRESAPADEFKSLCKCTFTEIYNERVYDLLDSGCPMVTVREDLKRGVFIDGLTEETVAAPAEATRVLGVGFRNRHVSATAMNHQSSRSHAIFTLRVATSVTHGSTGVSTVKQAQL